MLENDWNFEQNTNSKNANVAKSMELKLKK